MSFIVEPVADFQELGLLKGVVGWVCRVAAT